MWLTPVNLEGGVRGKIWPHQKIYRTCLNTPKDSQHIISYTLGEHLKPLEPVLSMKNKLKRSMTPFDLLKGVSKVKSDQ